MTWHNKRTPRNSVIPSLLRFGSNTPDAVRRVSIGTNAINILFASALLLCAGCLSPTRIYQVRLADNQPRKYEVEFGLWFLCDGGPCVAYVWPHKERAYIYVDRLEGTIPADEISMREFGGYAATGLKGSVTFMNAKMYVNLKEKRKAVWSERYYDAPCSLNGKYRFPAQVVGK